MRAVKIRYSQTEISIPTEAILGVLGLVCEAVIRVVALIVHH